MARGAQAGFVFVFLMGKLTWPQGAGRIGVEVLKAGSGVGG